MSAAEDIPRLEQLREERAQAMRRATEIVDAAEAENRDLTDEETTEFDACVDTQKRAKAQIERFEAADAMKPELRADVAVPARDPVDVLAPARANGTTVEEKTYRPDRMRERPFLRDLLAGRNGSSEARERLERNRLEALDHYGWTERDAEDYWAYSEQRDMQALSTQGIEFLPPLYLGSLFVEPNIAPRRFANALPSLPLPPSGVAITIPKLASGVAVAARADAGAVQETDGVTATISHDVNEVAGQVDIGRIAVMRSDPSLDTVIVRTLRRRYDAYLDTQLFSGTGTAPQHRGLDNVTSPNTVTYTQATPTAALTLPKLFDAIQQIASNRLEVYGDLIVMHPRRAAWLNSSLSTSVPLFQQGQLMQASGTQDQGFVQSLGGIEILQDPNITTAGGAGTNEDKIYVLAREDFILMEGPLMARVFDDVGSGNGIIRYQCFAYSAFLSNRYPKSLTIISGTGLVTPTF